MQAGPVCLVERIAADQLNFGAIVSIRFSLRPTPAYGSFRALELIASRDFHLVPILADHYGGRSPDSLCIWAADAIDYLADKMKS